ncbi:MAG: TonB C-terminal domain-containing protein [Muribaculaceae bacterium]|nr:TonB C-terminal domain-containing protein [Muribaculaceae bacterium]
MTKANQENPHSTPVSVRFGGMAGSLFVNVAIFLMIALSSSSSAPEAVAAAPQTVFCRYIDNGKLFQFDVVADDWQQAEEKVCGSHYKDVRLGGLLIEGAHLLLTTADSNLILRAQRESCSCSSEDKVPVLQDIGIVEAPRIGAEAPETALPRIFNAPEPSVENTIATVKSEKPPKKDNKPTQRTPSINDLLNAANYDPSRPISDKDPGGSADGSRLSNSATGKGDPYLQKVKAKLDNSMNAPASIPKAKLQKLSAKITISIGDGGILWKWDFVKKSGDDAFDKMIEVTLKQFMLNGTSRFAPPTDWKNKPIAISVEGKDIR